MEPRGDGFLLTEILTTKSFCSLSEDREVQKQLQTSTICRKGTSGKLENTAYCRGFHQKVIFVGQVKTNLNCPLFFIRSCLQVRSCAMIMVFLMQNGDEIQKLREQKVR